MVKTIRYFIIPGSHPTTCPGKAHLLLFLHWEEILTWLTSE
jgi:hypothetical protein